MSRSANLWPAGVLSRSTISVPRNRSEMPRARSARATATLSSGWRRIAFSSRLKRPVITAGATVNVSRIGKAASSAMVDLSITRLYTPVVYPCPSFCAKLGAPGLFSQPDRCEVSTFHANVLFPGPDADLPARQRDTQRDELQLRQAHRPDQPAAQ